LLYKLSLYNQTVFYIQISNKISQNRFHLRLRPGDGAVAQSLNLLFSAGVPISFHKLSPSDHDEDIDAGKADFPD
jgi:hypothetical protein